MEQQNMAELIDDLILAADFCDCKAETARDDAIINRAKAAALYRRLPTPKRKRAGLVFFETEVRGWTRNPNKLGKLPIRVNEKDCFTDMADFVDFLSTTGFGSLEKELVSEDPFGARKR